MQLLLNGLTNFSGMQMCIKLYTLVIQLGLREGGGCPVVSLLTVQVNWILAKFISCLTSDTRQNL